MGGGLKQITPSKGMELYPHMDTDLGHLLHGHENDHTELDIKQNSCCQPRPTALRQLLAPPLGTPPASGRPSLLCPIHSAWVRCTLGSSGYPSSLRSSLSVWDLAPRHPVHNTSAFNRAISPDPGITALDRCPNFQDACPIPAAKSRNTNKPYQSTSVDTPTGCRVKDFFHVCAAPSRSHSKTLSLELTLVARLPRLVNTHMLHWQNCHSSGEVEEQHVNAETQKAMTTAALQLGQSHVAMGIGMLAVVFSWSTWE